MIFIVPQHAVALSIGGPRHYLDAMSGFFFTLMIIAMVLTLGTLVLGLASMVKGGEFNLKYGNKIMRARVIMQGIAIGLFALAILSSGS